MRTASLSGELSAAAGFDSNACRHRGIRKTLGGKSADGCHNGATHANEMVQRPTGVGLPSIPWIRS
jgi:hypothetical protein